MRLMRGVHDESLRRPRPSASSRPLTVPTIWGTITTIWSSTGWSECELYGGRKLLGVYDRSRGGRFQYAQEFLSADVDLTTMASSQPIPVGAQLPAAETLSATNGSALYCGNHPEYVADPVNTSSGNYTESTTDISIPGRGVPASLMRTYNSLAAMTGSTGLFGPGWTSNLESNVATTSTGAIVTTEAGDQVTFTLANGVYTPPHSRSGDPGAQQRRLMDDGRARPTAHPDFQRSRAIDVDQGPRRKHHDIRMVGVQRHRDRPGGRTIIIVISGGHATSETDPSGTVTYAYNSAGELSL